MPAHRSIRNRRVRKKVGQGFELQLTTLIDVLVIILVFLLKSYQTSQNNLTTVPGLQMPISTSLDEPRDSHQVIITPEGITIEGNRIMDFIQTASTAGSTDAQYQFNPKDLDEGGKRVIPLYDALMKIKEKSDLVKAQVGARTAEGTIPEFDGILAITADKRVQYDTIRKIMYTAGAAGYKTFRFIAQRKEI